MSKEKELILEAKHVTKKFPLTKGKELIANDDVSLKFYKGQTMYFVEYWVEGDDTNAETGN